MTWYLILGIVLPVLALIGAFVKNAKWKRVVENSALVVSEAREALKDGKITKTEWLNIAATALGAFIPDNS